MLLCRRGLEAGDRESNGRPYHAGPEIRARQVVSKDKLVIEVT